jgi:hypothetical protein
MPLPRSITSRVEGDVLLRILRAVERFEDALKRGESPRAEAYLESAAGAERDVLLHQLLGIELDDRRQQGECPALAEYLRRFPADAQLVEGAFEEPTVTYLSAASTIDPHQGRLRDGEPLPVTIGKFLVLGRLGGGGQGAAYLARDPDLGRLVALKRYRAAGHGAEADCAIHDGKALTRLRSRYTPQCFGLERHGDELVLVMEYLPGRNLAEVIRSGSLAPRAAARLMEQVAEGLEAVHASGLVHRDIKPANVVLGDDGVPRLVDFGLAAHLGSAALEVISGTPSYMSPEQARGQSERIDARTDVYGLGATLYALLTEQAPHPGATSNEALEHARQAAVKRPRAWNRSVPSTLDHLVMKALATDPAQRFSSATEVRQALRRYRLGPRYAQAACLLGVLVLAGVGTYTAIRWSPPDSARQGDWVVHSQQLIKVDRGGRAIALRDAVPLRSGDKVWIECDLPAGWVASAFWLDSEGKITELTPFRIVRHPAYDRLSYPPPEGADNAVTLEGPAGTELVLVCARPQAKITLAEVEALIPADVAQTSLRERSAILITHGRVDLLNGGAVLATATKDDDERRLGRLESSDARAGEESFRQVAQALERRFAFTAGVAFPHR